MGRAAGLLAEILAAARAFAELLALLAARRGRRGGGGGRPADCDGPEDPPALARLDQAPGEAQPEPPVQAA